MYVLWNFFRESNIRWQIQYRLLTNMSLVSSTRKYSLNPGKEKST